MAIKGINHSQMISQIKQVVGHDNTLKDIHSMGTLPSESVGKRWFLLLSDCVRMTYIALYFDILVGLDIRPESV